MFRLPFTHIISTALLSSLPFPSQWLYTHSGSLNHIYASLARCIMCVQAPFHAYNINSFALLSLSLLIGSLNHIYVSLARCIMCVQALFHAHNINSFALLSPSPSSMALYAFRLSEPYICQLSSLHYVC